MSLRSLFVVIIAAAMLFAPFAMQSGVAMAAVPSNHHGQMMEKGHCGEQSETGKNGESSGKPCCVAMCAAIAIASGSQVAPLDYARSGEQPAIVRFGPSFLAKLPTPPPRRA